jgi:N-acetylglutamate synthase-like GNAT family acetyltransferase
MKFTTMITIQPFENQDTDHIVNLILNIQQNEFQVPITINEQQDLLNIPSFYQQGYGNFWVAKSEGEVVGTIALIDCGKNIGTIRKMFVKKEFRGKEHGIAQRLLDILQASSQENGITNLYLGTIERLQAAIRFYERNGFTLIEKQKLPSVFPLMAVDTHFFEKKIAPRSVERSTLITNVSSKTPPLVATGLLQVIEYQQVYKEDFKRINVEWIEKFFTVEQQDLVQLDNPQSIIDDGGQIYFAKLGDEIVGTAALIHDGDDEYELAKMGVSPNAQGLGLGKKLCIIAIEEAKKRKAKALYLRSNRSLIPAISMYLSVGFVEVPLDASHYKRANIKMDYPL